MTYQQKKDNLIKHVENLCEILNTNNEKERYRNRSTGEIIYSNWKVDTDDPVNTFMGGICYQKDAFRYLKQNNKIDIGVCWKCGEEPIKKEQIFSDSRDPSISFYICKDCFSSGLSLQSALGNNSSSSCYIATVCYNDVNANEVNVLRKFRDKVLVNNVVGYHLVKYYYLVSPSLSIWLAKKPLINKFVRFAILDWVVRIISKFSKY